MMVRSGAVAHLRRFRPTQTPSPSPSPVELPSSWLHVGDSQAGGRETEPTAVNPFDIFRAIWIASGYDAPTDTDDHGQSGRGTPLSFTRALASDITGTPWVHMQDSGSQNIDGQRTASEWGASFQSGMESVNTQWPGALLSWETAYSFSDARKAEPYRNWDTYNTELRARVTTLAGLGISVTIVESERNIIDLVAEIGYDTVCFPDDDPNAYHYQGIGNFIIALSMFEAFGYDVTALDHSGINLNSTHKSAAVAIVAGYQ